MLTDTAKNLSFDIDSCCICGLRNCFQVTDHEKISVDQLKNLILQNKKDLSEIDQLKLQVKTKFYKLKKQFNELVQKKEKSMIKWLDSFYFKHLENGTTIKNVQILCDIFENDLKQLPSKNVKKVVKTLSKLNSTKSNKYFESIKTVEEDINEMLQSIEIPKILEEVNKHLKTQKLSFFDKHQNKLSKSTDSVSTCHSSISANTKTVKTQIAPQLSTTFSSYEWKHIKITPITKILQLNNRHITDHDMIKQLPIISTFSNIKQLEIRNNKISGFSCSLIANQMRFLSMIDIRGNRVGDDGMMKIVANMNRLKGLYISQTGVSDKTGELIAANLPELQTLWAEHNRMTGESCIKISQKSKLRLLSLIGNPINQNHKGQIQIIFRSKGYINI